MLSNIDDSMAFTRIHTQACEFCRMHIKDTHLRRNDQGSRRFQPRPNQFDGSIKNKTHYIPLTVSGQFEAQA